MLNYNKNTNIKRKTKISIILLRVTTIIYSLDHND